LSFSPEETSHRQSLPMKKIIIVLGVLVLAGGLGGLVLYKLFTVQVSLLAAYTRNFLVSLGSPAGTLTPQAHPAYQAVAAAAPAPARPTMGGDDWPSYNRTLTSERFSPLAQIDAANVHKMKVLCVYDTQRLTAFETGLIMVRGALIGTTEFDIFSINPETC